MSPIVISGRTNKTLRVGAVTYLNSKPLVERLTEFAPNIELEFDWPSRLADRMAVGEIDVGLIPIAEYFRADCYSHIPGIGIVSRGPVHSVTLFSKVPWPEIRSLSLDIGSRTSAALVHILSTKRYAIRPSYRILPMDQRASDTTSDAVLLIGDRAMNAELPDHPYAFDLGEEWSVWTGLPMVYAVWAVRPGVVLGEIERAFHWAKDAGKHAANRIADRYAAELGLDPAFARRYLGEIIHYDLGPAERAGMAKFGELLKECPGPVVSM